MSASLPAMKPAEVIAFWNVTVSLAALDEASDLSSRMDSG